MASDDNNFYSDDVKAAAAADNNDDPDDVHPTGEEPVTSSEMKIGDLDKDAEEGRGSEESYDEEATPAGDNADDSDENPAN
jgi:hypothetical protein